LPIICIVLVTKHYSFISSVIGRRYHSTS